MVVVVEGMYATAASLEVRGRSYSGFLLLCRLAAPKVKEPSALPRRRLSMQRAEFQPHETGEGEGAVK